MARTFRRARGDSPRAAIWNGRCPGLGAIAPEPGAKCPREAVPRENGSGEGRVESASDDDVDGGGDKSNGLDQPHRPEADRKGVVSGKSVYVRVQHGGRRNIEKKNRVRTNH